MKWMKQKIKDSLIFCDMGIWTGLWLMNYINDLFVKCSGNSDKENNKLRNPRLGYSVWLVLDS